MRHAIAALLLGSALALPVHADTVDITSLDKCGRDNVYFLKNEVLLIELFSGQRALVQFTEMSRHKGTYRWRYKPAPGAAEVTGEGKVREVYEMTRISSYEEKATPLPGHDPELRAGDIRVRWLSGGDVGSYLCYDVSKARVTKLSADQFALTL